MSEIFTKRHKWILVATFFMGIAVYVLYILHQLGAFYQSEDIHTISFDYQPFLPGTEDMQYDSHSGSIYGISFDRWAWDSLKEVQGSIWRWNPDSSAQPAILNGQLPEIFHPHGMSLYRRDSLLWLLVINHVNDKTEQVDIFRIHSTDRFTYLGPIRHDVIISANDLVATGSHQFYLVNDSRSRKSLIRGLDIFFRRKTGNIVYYDGKDASIVVSGLRFPNGINISHDSSQLYISETIGGNLLSYQRNADQSLTAHQLYHIKPGLDNITIDHHGRLWIAIQPNLLATGKMLSNSEYDAPSAIVLFSPGMESSHKYIWAHPGEHLSGVSVALHTGKYILAGSVCESVIAISHHVAPSLK